MDNLNNPLTEDYFSDQEVLINQDLPITQHFESLDSISPLDPLPPTNTILSLTKRFRKCSIYERETLILFITKSNRQIKKEYLRCQIIRAVKRAMRFALCLKIPKNKMNRVDVHYPPSKHTWESFTETVRANQVISQILSATDSGPETDGKAVRKETAVAKSYNYSYCSYFFSQILPTDIYRKFLDHVFVDFRCRSMISRFEITPKCHGSKACSEMCNRSWRRLKEYLANYMISDLQDIEIP